jgi:hypothetical protein
MEVEGPGLHIRSHESNFNGSKYLEVSMKMTDGLVALVVRQTTAVMGAEVEGENLSAARGVDGSVYGRDTMWADMEATDDRLSGRSKPSGWST